LVGAGLGQFRPVARIGGFLQVNLGFLLQPLSDLFDVLRRGSHCFRHRGGGRLCCFSSLLACVYKLTHIGFLSRSRIRNGLLRNGVFLHASTVTFPPAEKCAASSSSVSSRE